MRVRGWCVGNFCALEDVPNSDEMEELTFYDFFKESYYAVTSQSFEGTVMMSKVGHWDETIEKHQIFEQFMSALGGGVIDLYELKSLQDDEPTLINRTVISDDDEYDYEDYEFDEDD